MTTDCSLNYEFNTCSELANFMNRNRNSIHNLSSYCGLVDARISASEKDLPVNVVFVGLAIYTSVCVYYLKWY